MGDIDLTRTRRPPRFRCAPAAGVAAALAIAWWGVVTKADAAPATNRYDAVFQEFARQDAAHPPPADPIVFTGSSSVRLWKTLARDFPGLPVLNRGFGGSTMTDLLQAFDRVIAPYRPAAAVIYCGENDIALGRDPIETADDYRELLRRCRALRPDMKIAVIAMKPSPKRWALWDAMRRANRRVAELCAEAEADFLDVAPLMLGADGLPRPELFLDDRLHMNADGYRIWIGLIEPWLRRRGRVPTPISAGLPASR